jgi:hypothetical protein
MFGICSNKKLKILNRKLDIILAYLEKMQRKENIMSIELDTLILQVEENREIEASAIVLIQGLADQIAAAQDDPVKIAELAATLKASADALGAAITANTTTPENPIPEPAA